MKPLAISFRANSLDDIIEHAPIAARAITEAINRELQITRRVQQGEPFTETYAALQKPLIITLAVVESEEDGK